MSEQHFTTLMETGVLSVWIPGRGRLSIELGADFGNGDGFHRLSPAMRQRVAEALARKPNILQMPEHEGHTDA